MYMKLWLSIKIWDINEREIFVFITTPIPRSIKHFVMFFGLIPYCF